MTEPARIARNTQRLTELYPAFRGRVEQVIQDLEALELRPRIQEGYRSPEDQMTVFREGHSQLRFGFHNVTGADGTPEALAVDLLDDDHPLNPSPGYLLHVAAAARAHGLETGILWGLEATLRAGVDSALAAGDFNARVKVGWDPTHIQPVGITPQQARHGKRPAQR